MNRINVLLLLDASRSLSRTDPSNSRQGGLEAAVLNLASLARSNPEVEISIAVDTFARDYTHRSGWLDAADVAAALNGQYRSITAIPPGGAGNFTDYRAAMNGVSDRFGSAPSSVCNLLLWFTDGEHATEGSSREISEAEWEQLQTLCASDAMSSLSANNLYSVGVLLSSPDAPVDSGPLRTLFGVGARACENELDGEIRDDVEAGDLRDSLDELINEVVYEVEAEAETDHDLPGEVDSLPGPDEYRVCSGGDGTASDPCEYSFSLDSGTDSFRLFLDMTFLERGISNPGAVNIVVQSPSGKRSEAVVSPTQVDGSSEAQYQPVRPFWFLSRRPYDSRWEIIGHQAAEQIADANDWEWAGQWRLLFWGETPEAASDAAKVAAAFRSITLEAPSASMSVNDEGTLIGFVENHPSDYISVELRIKLSDPSASLVYPTRPYLKCQWSDCEPVPVSEDDKRFEVFRLSEEVVWWDSEPGGGDGLRLRAALAEHGSVSAVAVMEQTFLYGGVGGWGGDGSSGRPLEWSRDIGALALNDLPSLLAGQNEWDELSSWVDSGAPQALPTNLRLAPPPYGGGGNNVVFRVDARPGYLPGVIVLEDLSTQTGSGSAPRPRYDPGWTCEVPGTYGEGGLEVYECGAIRVDLGLSEDSDVTARMDFGIAPVADLESAVRTERLAVPSEEEWNELLGAIQQASLRNFHSLESDRFSVDLPTPSDKWNEFLPILALLIALASASRVFVAWRLRPWSSLGTPEYVIKPLDLHGDGLTAIESERHLCMELTAPKTRASLGGLEMSSRWVPLLRGNPPSLLARSARAGGCTGPGGHRMSRKGARMGIIGPSLRDGWIVHSVEQQHELVLWDLPTDEIDQQRRISEIEETAHEGLAGDRPTSESQRRAESSGEDSSFDIFSAPTDDSSPPSDPFGSSDDLFD